MIDHMDTAFPGFLKSLQSPWARPHSEGCRIFLPGSTSSHWVHQPASPQVLQEEQRCEQRSPRVEEGTSRTSAVASGPQTWLQRDKAACVRWGGRGLQGQVHSVRRWFWPVAGDLGRGQEGKTAGTCCPLEMNHPSHTAEGERHMAGVTASRSPSCFSGKYDAADGGRWDGRSAAQPGRGKVVRVSVGKIQLEVTTSPSHGDTIPDAQHRPSTTPLALCTHSADPRGLLILPLSWSRRKSPLFGA